MRLTTALLCDFAQVRDGLLFVSSGAVNRLWRPAVPARLGVMLALVVMVEGVDELSSRHEVRGDIVDGASLEPVASFTAALAARPELVERNPAGEPVLLPMPVDLRQVAIPRFGSYRMALHVDGALLSELPFAMAPRPRRPPST